MQAVGSIFKDGEPLHSAVNKAGKGRRKSLLGVVLVGTSVYDCARYAGIAQLVEQRIRNAQVMGSSPFTGSTVHFVFPKNFFYTAYLGGFFLPFFTIFCTLTAPYS